VIAEFHRKYTDANRKAECAYSAPSSPAMAPNRLPWGVDLSYQTHAASKQDKKVRD